MTVNIVMVKHYHSFISLFHLIMFLNTMKLRILIQILIIITFYSNINHFLKANSCLILLFSILSHFI